METLNSMAKNNLPFFFVNERGEHTSIAIKTKLNNKTIGCFRTLFLMALTDQFQSSSGQNGN